MKTIFIMVPYLKTPLDLLKSDFLKILKERGLRIVLLSAVLNGKPICQQFADGDRVIVEPSHEVITTQKVAGKEQAADSHRLGTAELLFHEFRKAIFIGVKTPPTLVLAYKKWAQRKFSSLISFSRYLLYLLGIAIGKAARLFSPDAKRLREFLKDIHIKLFPDRFYAELFTRYKPSLVFTIHSHYETAEVSSLKAAVQHKVPTIAFVQSWDKLTSKGEIPVRMNKLIVWNEINKQEAIELHNYSPKDVYVSGTPQFDHYFRPQEWLLPKEEFFRHIGADSSKKLLTYTVGSLDISPEEPEDAEIIARAIEEGKFIYPCQLLVRLYGGPNHPGFQKLKNRHDVIVDGSASLYDVNDPTLSHAYHLANTLYHSDVVINITSTIALEASILDKPVVMVYFDGYQKKPYLKSILSSYDYEHNAKLAQMGGARYAATPEELIQYINDYLKDPTLEREGRKRVAREWCYYQDGKSAERVAKYVVEYLDPLEGGKR